MDPQCCKELQETQGLQTTSLLLSVHIYWTAWKCTNLNGDPFTWKSVSSKNKVLYVKNSCLSITRVAEWFNITYNSLKLRFQYFLIVWACQYITTLIACWRRQRDALLTFSFTKCGMLRLININCKLECFSYKGKSAC